MARRRRQHSHDTDGLPLITWIVLISVALSFISDHWQIFLIMAILAVALIVTIVIVKKKKHNKKAASLADIDGLDGLSFEKYTADMLARLGYKKVKLTPASGDFGVDITAELNGEKWAFQCKRYTGNLGVKPVQEVFAGAVKYRALKAVVVTNSYFTDAAQELADDTGVILWDREYLKKMIKGLNSHIANTVERKNKRS